jgi:hypothetical protein
MSTTTCDVCGAAYGIGDSPYCRDHHRPWSGRDAQPFDPVVVFQAPDGSYRFPGSPTGRASQRYESQGFARVELRTIAEVRSFTGRVNRAEAAKVEQRVERRQQHRAAREEALRGDLRQRMQRMSPLGRDVAREAMARNDRRPIRGFDPGCHFEVFEYDRSNRDAARRPDGTRARD